MNTYFIGGLTVNDPIIKQVTIIVNDVIKPDFIEDQGKLAGKGKYIAVYNRQREELDLKSLNSKIDTIRKKYSKCQIQMFCRNLCRI